MFIVDGTALEVTSLWDTAGMNLVLQKSGYLDSLVESVTIFADLTVSDGDGFMVGLLKLIDSHRLAVLDHLGVILGTADIQSSLLAEIGNVTLGATHTLRTSGLWWNPVVVAIFDDISLGDWDTSSIIGVQGVPLLAKVAESLWESWDLETEDAVIEVGAVTLWSLWDNLVPVAVEAFKEALHWVLGIGQTSVFWGWLWWALGEGSSDE